MTILLFLSLLAFADEKPLTIQMAAEPNTLDPRHVSDVIGFNIISNVAEGLVRLDAQGKLQPGLASSFTVSKDQKEYRFQIKKDAKWSDGKAITVDDFIFGLQTTLDPKTAARDASFLSDIEELKKKGTLLIIRLKKPNASFLQALSMPMASPLRKENFLANQGKWKIEDPVSGPFRITAQKIDKEIQLEPNPFYKAAKKSILFKIIPEETTALNLFETQRLDVLSTIPSTEIHRLEKDDTLFSAPSSASFYLAFNVKKPPFDDPKWRKAIAAAIDREGLAKLQPKALKPTRSYLPSALDGSTKYSLTPFEEEKNWLKAQKKPEVNMIYASSALSNLLLQRIQNDLKKKLDLTIKLEPLEWKSYLGRLEGDAPPIFYMGYSAPFNDPISHLKIFLSSEHDNRSNYSSPKYDALVEKFRSLPLGSERTKAAQDAQKVLVLEDAAVIPLLERQQIFGVQKWVKGFHVNPFGVMDLRNLEKP